MNRIATRAFIVLILVLALAGGMVFFVGEYMAGAEDWVMFSGSPHVYSGSKLRAGAVYDRNGVLLADLSGERTYATEEVLRKATLHWVGDRLGNISVPAMGYYTQDMLGYDLVNGVYAYGDTKGSLELTLSSQLQQTALEAMGSHIGTLSVYNYKTGELLCAVTTPTYDPDNVPDIAADTTGAYTGVYVNRFTQSKYIPGSIFKIVTLAAALETLPEIQQMQFTCTGIYEIDSGDVTCMRPHGTQTIKEAFCNSCNCAFAQITQLIGKEKLQRYVQLFGVIDPVNFDGITTVAGNFDVEKATGEEVAWSGIGQHKDQVNPCAYLRFVGAIANGGAGTKLHVVSNAYAGGKATYTAKAQREERILSQETVALLREFMQNNVDSKYGAENFSGLTVCAKSGTGEVGADKKPNAMFAGFVADESYPLAFVVAIEEGGFGADTCVPVISKVLAACKSEIDSQNPWQ